MKKIGAINCCPRSAWNTATLVREAAKGAEKQGAEVELLDLYKLEKFTGCVSCFGCKLPQSLGKCICRDGLTSVPWQVSVLLPLQRWVRADMLPQKFW